MLLRSNHKIEKVIKQIQNKLIFNKKMANVFNEFMAFNNVKSLLSELIGDKKTIEAQQTQINELKEKYNILDMYNKKIINNSRCPDHMVCANKGTHGCEIVAFDYYDYGGEEYKSCDICGSFICETCGQKTRCYNCAFLICKNCEFDEDIRQDHLDWMIKNMLIYEKCKDCTESNYYWNRLKKKNQNEAKQ